MAAFYFRGEFVGLGSDPWTVARYINSGDFDRKADFQVSSLKVPLDVNDWNDFDGSPKYQILFE